MTSSMHAVRSSAFLSRSRPQPAWLAATALVAAAIVVAPARAEPLPASVDAATAQSTRAIANELLTRLGGTLKSTLASDGPQAAIGVCKQVAPAIAGELSAAHGAEVRRVALRARNQQMGVPNDWQKEALAELNARLTGGEKPAEAEYWRVVDKGGKRELHYAKPIVMQQMCVTCHGSTQEIPPAVLEKIRADYPDDQATGYLVGKLRGAVVITRPLAAD